MNFKLAILFLLFAPVAAAQYDIGEIAEDSSSARREIPWFSIRQKTYVGGELSMQFGSASYVYISPMAGYDILPSLSAGITGMYQLYRMKYSTGAVVSDHSYGGGLFVRYRPFDFLVTQAEIDLYNTTDYTVLFGDRVNVPAVMFGAGYTGEMGNRGYFSIMLMYDFIHDENMPLPQIITGIPLYLRYGFVWYLG